MEPPSGFTKDGDHAEYSDMIHDASTDGNSTTEHRASVNPTQPPSVRRALGYSDSSSTQNPSSKEPLPSLAGSAARKMRRLGNPWSFGKDEGLKTTTNGISKAYEMPPRSAKGILENTQETNDAPGLAPATKRGRSDFISSLGFTGSSVKRQRGEDYNAKSHEVFITEYFEPMTTWTLLYPPNDKRREIITSQDLLVLNDGGRLNDAVINFYLRVLDHQLEKAPGVAKSIYFS